ncbi:hypothetical protein PUW24_24070 [Paenibacillus urinalis]|uniref:Uncharacterized protein n=1 Tax=Paenibacillus urinalis TaxID=521520 RepID=A0AAX3MVG6_9BACL|nr:MULTISPECIES: hypothetical protein [Paenibacillus]WDH81121.1 hypothetical protein PUW23_16470 [Paenibacillus urinalis]WDH97174.1 hypothetical protein PUW24_24070 [Paenibacillus urinalis]WDI00836.1 hypothetical protein PUW25_16295 [Paenibacillus urinalis]GAK39521.1 hypothetical protein TCA2_2009 [Paenibacillus sp. TCA20]
MEKYKFFNSAPDDPRTYEASDFAEYFGSVLSTGLLHTDHVPGMEVSVAAGTLNTVVSAGKAIMLGRLYENTSDLTLTHSIPEATLNRIDRIVLRLDLRNSARNIHLAIKEGAAGATPVPPELTRDNFIYELSLAQILVRANTSQLQQADLVDERLYEDLCGIVYSLISIPTEQFQRQWDEFIGGIEDEGFATTGYVNEQVAVTETNAKNASLSRTGGTVNGVVTVNNPNLLGSTAGSIVDGITTNFSTGNQSKLVTRAMRVSNGNTWTSEAIELARYVDATQQATLRFEGDEIRFKNADNTWTSLRELKQSGVNAKQGIVDAINAMGGSASTGDIWSTLHTKIRGLYTGKKYVEGSLGTLSGNGYKSIYIGFVPSVVIVSSRYYDTANPLSLIYAIKSNKGTEEYDSNGYLRLGNFGTSMTVSNHVSNPHYDVTWQAWE